MKKKTSMVRKSISLGMAFLMMLSVGMSGINVQGEETERKTVAVKAETLEHACVKLNDSENQEIKVDLGSRVKIDVESENGYQVDEVTAEDSEGYKTKVTQNEASYYVTADTDLTIKVTISDLQVVKPGSEELDGETSTVDDGKESGTGRVAPYDADAFNELITSICDFGNISDIMPMANVGEGITTLPSIKDGGRATDFVRYYPDGSYVVEHSYDEGRFTTTDGEEVYCCYPDFMNTIYYVGEYASYDATRRFDEETIKTIGMMLYYFDNYADCSGLTTTQRYLIRQCVVWSVAGPYWGLNPGCTIEYGNGMQDADGHNIAGITGNALIHGAEFAADPDNRAEFTCWGIVFETENTFAGTGNVQLLSQWFYEREEKPETGELDLQKVSSNHYLTDDIPCYSLEGAVYEVTNTDGEVVGTLTTKEDGSTDKLTLDEGTYYVQETSPSKGYGYDYTTHEVTVTAGETATVTSEEPPLADPLGITITKIDRDSNGASNVRGLEGARFEVKYYAINPDDYNSVSDLDGLDATRIWVLETKYDKADGKCKAGLDDEFKVAGDDFYYDDNESKCLPIGVITVEEISAPEGYTTDGAIFSSDTMTGPVEGKYFSKITGDGEDIRLKGGNEYTVSDKSIRGGVKVAKWDNEANKQEPQGDATLDNTKIDIINKNDYDVVVNGQTYGKDQVVMTLTTDYKGNAQTSSDALPYGTYEVREFGAPTGYQGSGKNLSQEFFIGEDGVIVDLSGDANAVKNDVIRGGVKVAKWDKETNTQSAQGGATLQGATFEIISQNNNYVIVNGKSYKKGEVVATIKTDEKGVAQTSATLLPYGTYTLKETGAPTGYLNQGTNIAQTFTIRENGVVVDLNKDATAIKNNVIRGGVKVAKWDKESNSQSPQGDATLQGATFAIISQNSNYVIVNGKSYKKGEVVATIKTDEKGVAQTSATLLPYGTYTLKETGAPTGYLNQGTNIAQTFTIRENGVVVDLNKDATAIKNDINRGGVKLGKWDNESKTQKAQGAATLEGAEFAITNESAHDVIVDGKTYKKGEVVATLVTDENGIAKSASNLLSYGKYSYEEVKEPKGYLPTGSGLTGTFEIKEDGIIVDLNKKDTAIKNNVIRGDITFTKSDAETSERMANIPFKITSNTTGESHVIYTDENGYYSSESKYVKHSENTNAETAKCGTWFGLDIDGNQVPVNDSVGAFPYDTYTIQELRCESNVDKALFKGTFTISMHGFTIDYGTITNSDLSLQTTAKSANANTHHAYASNDVTIVDTVFYTGLKKNQTYTIKGIIMDKDTKEPLLDVDGNQITAETTFKAPTKDGITDVTFTFNGTGMDGKDVVVFEECYDKDGNMVVDHKDIKDEGQTIYFEKNPEIKTTAKDAETEDHISAAKEEVTIVDTVSYKNLTVGKKYTVAGTLMDKNTGKSVKDEDGNPITAETTFKAETGNGSVDVTFTFDSSALAGKTTVVFEELYHNGKLVTTHAVLEDEEQTVYFPEIHTTAKDVASESQSALATKETTIVDTVTYTNLIPGKEYTVTGTLMDTETGEKLVDAKGNEVTAETTFTAEKANGEAIVIFTFNASTLAGKTSVVFEDLYLNEKLVATHSDINDEGQTVHFPEIKTTAKDVASNSHNALPSKKTTIVDTVKYTNLIVGKTYTVKGVLMDKDTKKPLLDNLLNQITGETTFTATEASGEVEITFTFDSSALAGKTVVAFEDLYYNEKVVATHSDITDKDQTVHFPEIKTTATDKEDGDHTLTTGKVTVVDTVKYENLVPGQEYKVSGVLMDKSTGEKVFVDNKEVTGEATFTPEKANGTVEVTFTFDASSLEKKELVVFEKIYNAEGKEIANHEDLEDDEQTITVREKEKVVTSAPSSPDEMKKTVYTVKTGDETQGFLYIVVIAATLVIGCIVMIRRKKRMK